MFSILVVSLRCQIAANEQGLLKYGYLEDFSKPMFCCLLKIISLALARQPVFWQAAVCGG
jgi:hypothetical protein